MTSSDHPKVSMAPTRVLSGKDKAEILDRKVADLRRRTKLKRLHSFEETRARDSQNRLNKIYAKFHRSGNSKGSKTLHRSHSSVLPKTITVEKDHRVSVSQRIPNKEMIGDLKKPIERLTVGLDGEASRAETSRAETGKSEAGKTEAGKTEAGKTEADKADKADKAETSSVSRSTASISSSLPSSSASSSSSPSSSSSSPSPSKQVPSSGESKQDIRGTAAETLVNASTDASLGSTDTTADATADATTNASIIISSSSSNSTSTSSKDFTGTIIVSSTQEKKKRKVGPRQGTTNKENESEKAGIGMYHAFRISQASHRSGGSPGSGESSSTNASNAFRGSTSKESNALRGSTSKPSGLSSKPNHAASKSPRSPAGAVTSRPSPRLRISFSAATSLISSFSPYSHSSPLNLPDEPPREESPSTPRRVVFSSDLESSPSKSSPIKGAPEPKSILKNLESAASSQPQNNSVEDVLGRDLSKQDSWPNGFVLQLMPGSPSIKKVVDGCIKALDDPYFPKKYEVFATLNDIIKVNNRDLTKDMLDNDQIHTLVKSIDVELANTGRELKSGINAFRIRTAIQALKLLTFIMTHHQIRGSASMLKRVSTMFLSANLSKGLAAALLQLMKDQQNNMPPSTVEHVTAAILQMKYFLSTTIITEKLMTIKKLIALHPAVMAKISYQWMSYVLCCILNTEVPSYERIVNACIYVLYEFSKNSESKDVVFQLLNETLNENASSIRASTVDSLSADTKIVDALTLTLVYMINRGWSAQALDIWTYMTFMIGCRLTNQVDLENWPGLRHWIKVFDEALKYDSDDVKVAALNSWRSVIYNYQSSRSFSSASLKKDSFDRKRCIFLYPFTVVPAGKCSPAIVDAYVALYYRIVRFLRTLCISTDTKKTVDPAWALNCVFSPFYLVFLKRQEFFGAGIKLLQGVLKFTEKPTVKSLESAEACFRKTSIDGWTVSCLPKQFLLSYYSLYFDLISFLLFNEDVSIADKMEVFNGLTETLEECTKNAIVAYDAVDGFMKLLDTYLRQVMFQSEPEGAKIPHEDDSKDAAATDEPVHCSASAPPSISYLCSIVLRAKSIFGLRILTGKTVSMNLVTLMGAFIFHWYGSAGIHEFIDSLYPVLTKKVASLFFGLTLLRDNDVNNALVEELANSSVSLSVMFSDFETWKDVIVKLRLDTDHFNVIIDKIVQYESQQNNQARYKEMAKFLSDWITLQPLSTESAQLLLSEYAVHVTSCEESSFSPVSEIFGTFMKGVNVSQLSDFVICLPEDKCPYSWYSAIASVAVTLKDKEKTASIRSWLNDSIPYLKERYPDRYGKLIDMINSLEETKEVQVESTIVVAVDEDEYEDARLPPEKEGVELIERVSSASIEQLDSSPLSEESPATGVEVSKEAEGEISTPTPSSRKRRRSLSSPNKVKRIELLEVVEVEKSTQKEALELLPEPEPKPQIDVAEDLEQVEQTEQSDALLQPHKEPVAEPIAKAPPSNAIPPYPPYAFPGYFPYLLPRFGVHSTSPSPRDSESPQPDGENQLSHPSVPQQTYQQQPLYPYPPFYMSPYGFGVLPQMMPAVAPGKSGNPLITELESALAKLSSDPAELVGMNVDRKKALEDNLLGLLVRLRGIQ